MKYYIWVLGCAMNNSDAERIATILELFGYQKTAIEAEADVIVTVACSVRQTAIDRIYGHAKVWKKLRFKNPEVVTILTGCVLDKDRMTFSGIVDAVLPIEEIGKIAKILPNSKVQLPKEGAKQKSGEYLSIMPKYESSFRAYVPIMTGCNNFCSYCAVPYTRGREKSRPELEILTEAKALIKNGYKEITFLGQNVNSYGHDIGGNQKDSEPFISLLKKLDAIPGEWRGYFYSNHPKDISDDLIKLMPTLKHFPAYIHFPLQSGSNRIIREMNRHYTQEEYLGKVAKLRSAMPGLTLTTDIIVGYPGESEEDFAETLKVARKARFDMIFSAQYSPRPGAKSEKLKDDVTRLEKKRREKEVISVLSKTVSDHNQKLVGSVQRVLVDESKKGKYFGRTRGYKVVEIKTDQPLWAGQFIDVTIESAGPWKLVGLL